MRFHLLALPNVQTTRAYELDGFCVATIRFAKLLKQLGHTVILYASEENEACCDELVTVITKEEQQTLLGKGEYQYAAMEGNYPLWALANPRIIAGIAQRKQARDFIAIIGGASHKTVADAHPDLLTFEYLIGYVSSFAKYRVFASHYWRGVTHGFSDEWDGRFFDTVIYGFAEETEFTFQPNKEPFALYVGRLTAKKGLAIACEACAIAGVQLKAIGHGDPSLLTHGAEYLGPLNSEERNKWLARASVMLTPTTYIEPLGNTAIEAQLCGTPVVSTDFGGFVETVEHGKTGYRCNTLGEFVEGIKMAPKLDPLYIRHRAVEMFTMQNNAKHYQRYFERLALLWEKGWNTL